MDASPSRRGRALELYFVDGVPEGLVTAGIFGWTGHVLRIPRLRLADGLRRAEARHTGAYLLLGARDDAPLAYVGEAENVAERIRTHDAQKDWWNEALILTTVANDLHKAHVRYIEARLVELARVAGQAKLENGNTPAPASLSEAARAGMEEFLDTVAIVLAALNVDLLRSGRRAERREVPDGGGGVALFRLSSPKHGVMGDARLEGSDLVVLKGSRARGSYAGSEKWRAYRPLYEKLCAEGVLLPDGDGRVFGQDYAFASPSAAAAVLNGRSANGRLEWRHSGTGMPYGDWEAEQLKDFAP